VFAPSRWFGGAALTTAGQVVLVETQNGRFGIQVDRVTPVGRVAAGQLAPPPAVGAAEWLTGVLQTADGPLGVVDVDRLNSPVAAPQPSHSSVAPASRAAGGDRWLAIGWGEVAGRSVAVAVPMSLVVEVIDAPPASPIPGAPPHVRGLVEWRGGPLVVADPAEWVGLGGSKVSPRVVVVRAGGTKVGLAAGATVKVLGDAPCVTSRRTLPHTPETVLVAFDTTDETVVCPAWAAFFRSLAAKADLPTPAR
jgi:purine-binding chemotaxis protein CheW